ncbi:GAL80 (YML051W) [Zygosaccharomyces parabailii]|uniref:BN860_15522g1_1 n=1 Tax=Zygosaccharomyces bailii (strain CLIB 213 / ATCC 58445 / CBS 680 / BCRC 21525 / NBRC 1098 / NCYC 1416 / NRRL Y-2227) TaxID=1333698 RepID=A0A8J2X9J8_ZYGB2|nr:GAL80 (YML051W) [Zygosaccharomyces parabailii]CDF88663.1 BN860_15522g1_1 [Zygosaccharomyces bailii CLIB 213]
MDHNKRSAVSTVPDAAPIRVGFIGLNWNKGWALKTHRPAISQLSSQFLITALYDEDQEAVVTTIQKLRLVHATAFTSLEAFSSFKNIDMIVVSIRASKQYEVLMSILKHSATNLSLKYLFIEWAFGSNLQQAQEIYDATAQRRLQTIVALQGRKSPYIQRAKELIHENYIGEINSVEIAGNACWFGYERSRKFAPGMFEMGNGLDLVTTTFGHTIDLLQYITESYFSKINALIFNNIPNQTLVDDLGNPMGRTVPKSVPDHLLFHGSLQRGNIPVACSIKGGKPTKKFTKNFVIDIHGTRGDIKLEGDAGFAEMSNLVLYYNGIRANDHPAAGEKLSSEQGKEFMEVYHLRNYDAVHGNIFRLYQSIADFHFNTRKIPNLPSHFIMQGFEFEGFPTLMDGLILRKLIDSVYRSSSLGSTLDVTNTLQFAFM